MEKKVYEGYKRSTASSQSADIKAVSDVTSKVTTKTPRATTARKSAVKKPRIAMYIDVDNVGISRENLLEVLFYANGKYKIDQCKLYGFSEFYNNKRERSRINKGSNKWAFTFSIS